MIDRLPAQLAADIEAVVEQIPGWTNLEKAIDMARVILTDRSRLVVEIGVYYGRSLVAQARALKHVGHGRVAGIDPYRPTPTQEGTNPPSEVWWKDADFEAIRTAFGEYVRAFGVERQVELIHSTSANAIDYFEGKIIDVLHVDGNHSPEVSCADVNTYLPLVKVGGYVWMDDTDWPELEPALELVGRSCRLVKDYARFRLYQKLPRDV